MPMTAEEKRDAIDNVLYQKFEGCESLIYIAEEYALTVKDVDLKLFDAMTALLTAADEMSGRMRDLNDELDLGYED